MPTPGHSAPTPRPPSLRLAAISRMLVRSVSSEVQGQLASQGFGDVRPAHNAVFGQVLAGRCRITSMAEHLGITKQAVTWLVGQLEEGGYAMRHPDPLDGRAKVVALTDRGRQAAAASVAAANHIESKWSVAVESARLEQCKDTLWRLLSHIRTTGSAPAGSARTGPPPHLGSAH